MSVEVAQVWVRHGLRQFDAQLSTLRSYIEALGDELELTSVFGDERCDVVVE